MTVDDKILVKGFVKSIVDEYDVVEVIGLYVEPEPEFEDV